MPRRSGLRAKFYELQATTHFARWLESENRAAEACTVLRRMYSWFTEGFDALALTEGRTLLEDSMPSLFRSGLGHVEQGIEEMVRIEEGQDLAV